MALPVMKVVKPSTLIGQVNGRLSQDRLSLIGVGTALMEYTAARAFRAMFAAARAAGFVIKEVGDYRTFLEQLTLFLQRYKPVDSVTWNNTPTAHRKRWHEATGYGYPSTYWIKKNFAEATAATPGYPNHGWGLALDIAEEYDTDPQADPISSKFVNWLVTNAGRYGISAELQSEPWHWHYYSGDQIPQAVLDFEAAIPPPVPEPIPEPIPIPTPPGGTFEVNVTRTEVKLGSSGLWVERLQATLNSVWNQDVGNSDGQFGPRTEQGVKNAQAWANGKGWANPPLTVDGICGPKTWAVLENFPNPQNP